jgi:xanthine dehydrogenase large subunit
VINSDAYLYVRGEAQFIDDTTTSEGTLYAAVLASPVAHGKITQFNIAPAQALEGVDVVLTAAHIPGANQIGNLILDEPLLAVDEVHYCGQPLALVVAHQADIAHQAVQAIVIQFTEQPAILDVRQAYRLGHLLLPPRTCSWGNIAKAWSQCDVVIAGTVESGGQEHVYLETQSAWAYPTENKGLKIRAATQSPSLVQRLVARVLGLPMHQIEVEVPRLGGSFGGKKEQAKTWAILVALAAFHLQQPVKLILSRDEDMRMTGKRHSYLADFKIGLTHTGEILAYEVTFYQNAGAAADLSPAILERTLFHVTNSYFIPHVKATAISCRTHLPPNTAFRGFGVPQAVLVIEAAIAKAAEKLGVTPAVIQQKNLFKTSEQFPNGVTVTSNQIQSCWEMAGQQYEVDKLAAQIKKFNANHPFHKKGLAVIPICFGIPFNSAWLNQASTLVQINVDGSVSVNTSAIEMGQGINSKIRQTIATILSINTNRIKLDSTNTSRIANISPTAASCSADLNCQATKQASLTILARLETVIRKTLHLSSTDEITIKNEIVCVNDQATELTWSKLIPLAYFNQASLSAQSHATSHLYFNNQLKLDHNFVYYVFGTAITTATVDCLRGTYQIDSVKVVHNFGNSFNPLIDRGQIEGGIVQGIGWMTIEELIYNDKGQLLTDCLSTYKIPDIYSAPQEISVHFLEATTNNPAELFNSTAVGDPPLIYGIGAYFAIWQAMTAFRPELQLTVSTPLTPEKVLLALYSRGDKN